MIVLHIIVSVHASGDDQQCLISQGVQQVLPVLSWGSEVSNQLRETNGEGKNNLKQDENEAEIAMNRKGPHSIVGHDFFK